MMPQQIENTTKKTVSTETLDALSALCALHKLHCDRSEFDGQVHSHRIGPEEIDNLVGGAEELRKVGLEISDFHLLEVAENLLCQAMDHLRTPEAHARFIALLNS